MSDLPETFRLRFIDRCRGDLAELEAGPDDAALRRLIHGLAGAAGTFGFPRISEMAGVIDDDLSQGREPDPARLEALRAALRDLVRPVR
jgi:HPt (histidine-containing phosphotransfer) domain-containing protein